MSDSQPLVVEPSLEDATTEEPEVTILARDPGGQTSKRKGRAASETRSPVWDFFEQKIVAGDGLAFCTVKGCPKTNGFKYEGSTGVPSSHMESKHRKPWDSSRSEGRGKASKTNNSMDRYVGATPGLWELVLKWIVMTNQPLSTVDSPWFKEMLLAANPKLSMIGRKVGTKTPQKFKMSSTNCCKYCNM